MTLGDNKQGVRFGPETTWFRGLFVSALKTPSFTDLGLFYKAIHDAGQMRDAEEADPSVTCRTLRRLNHLDGPISGHHVQEQ